MLVSSRHFSSPSQLNSQPTAGTSSPRQVVTVLPSPRLVTSGLLLIVLTLWTPSLPVVAASSVPHAFRTVVDPTSRRSRERRWSVRPAAVGPGVPHRQSCVVQLRSKIPLTASAFNLAVQMGDVLSVIARCQLAVELDSAVLVANGTSTFSGSSYKYTEIAGFDTFLLPPNRFPLPGDREVMLASQGLLDGVPAYHKSLTWQFFHAHLNTVGCIYNEYDSVRQEPRTTTQRSPTWTRNERNTGSGGACGRIGMFACGHVESQGLTVPESQSACGENERRAVDALTCSFVDFSLSIMVP